MASPRQIRLAQLLAEGRGGVGAMLEAGWPQNMASLIGPWAHEYLRRAGLGTEAAEAPESAAPVADLPAELPVVPTASDTPDPEAEAPESAATAEDAEAHSQRSEGRRKRSNP